jgi:hypothetical protein
MRERVLMPWIDRAARRAAASGAPDRLTGLVERRNLTRRQALKGLAAGAVLAGPASALLSAPDARGASCLRVDPACGREAERAFDAAVGGCKRDSLWAELRCRVQAQNALSAARQACRVPDHSRCPAGQACDGSGTCVAGDTVPPAEAGGPVGTGPCAHDYPTEASLTAARTALAAGADVVDLSPGGCMRLERAGDVERTTVAGTVVAELVTTATGMTGRRDDDRDGFFEATFEIGQGESEFVWRDPATRAVRRRETRKREGALVHVVIEEDGEVVQQFKTAQNSPPPSLARFTDDPEFCGPALDAKFGDLMMKAVHRTTKCLEERGAGDVANEMLYAALHSTIVCGDIDGAYAAAIDAGDGARAGRIQINVGANEGRLTNDIIETLAHELLHYTSLGLHDEAHTGNDDSRMEEGDRVYACSILCAGGAASAPTRCHCATCLQTDVCDERCKRDVPCSNPDMGAICPCLLRNKWYPTFEECAVDCSRGLACFGFSKCKSLSKAC